MYTHQVNYEKVFTSGMLKGIRYTNSYLKFCSLSDAEAFAVKDGEVLECASGTGNYRMEYPIITDLTKF